MVTMSTTVELETPDHGELEVDVEVEEVTPGDAALTLLVALKALGTAAHPDS